MGREEKVCDVPIDSKEIHRAAVVVDAHNDITSALKDAEGYDFFRRNSSHHTDLVRLSQGGVDAVFMVAFADPKAFAGEEAWPRTLEMVGIVRETVERSEGRLAFARSLDDVRKASRGGQIALLLGVEGGHCLGDISNGDGALDRLGELHALGVSYLTLAWEISNALAGSCSDGGSETGLTDLGREAVRLMNRLGMLVDVSHLSDAAFWDAIDVTERPVIASHSSARALADHERNLSDEMLRAVADNGGVVCINFWPELLSDDWAGRASAQEQAHKKEFDAIEEANRNDPLRAKRLRWARSSELKKRLDPVRLSVLIDHIEHVAQVAGIDHVGIGSDFDGITALPEGIEDASSLSAVTEGLVARRYTAEEIRKILGENVLRII